MSRSLRFLTSHRLALISRVPRPFLRRARGPTAKPPLCSMAAQPTRADRDRELMAAMCAAAVTGELRWGSRTPIKDTPAWVTPHVTRGGFASGFLLAGSHRWEDFELKLMQQHMNPAMEPRYAVPQPSARGQQVAAFDDDDDYDDDDYDDDDDDDDACDDVRGARSAIADRTLLNCHFVTGAGLAELQQRLASGCYRVEVPEEGALLVFAWLLGQGKEAEACDLLEVLVPWFDRLRFFPRLTDQPLPSIPDVVHVRTVQDVRNSLEAAKVPKTILLLEKAFGTWRPLTDELLALFLETVNGAAPALVTDSQGQPMRIATGASSWQVQGGWPCQVYPEGWADRARAVLQRLQGEQLPKGRKHRLVRAVRLLRKCVDTPADLTGQEVSALRESMATWVHRRGSPGSPELAAAAAADLKQAEACQNQPRAVAELLQRLQPFPGDGGCTLRPEELLAPPREQRRLSPSLERKAARCLDLPLEQHLQQRSIPSAETLASVLPQLSSRVVGYALADAQRQTVLAAGATDTSHLDAAGRLLTALYVAFRRRRSLLLLNLQTQVRLQELPWVAALTAALQPATAPADGGRELRHEAAGQAAARQLLRQAATQYLRYFPGILLPNKFMKELDSLAETAGLRRTDFPLCDELAADIFMNAWSMKFLRAAQISMRYMQHTLYASYYDIDTQELLHFPQTKEGRGAELFGELCQRRAAAFVPATHHGSYVARNGTVIEQGQILTTHNLAVLASVLELGLQQEQLEGMAQSAWRTFMQLVLKARTMSAASGNGRAWQLKLQSVKNASYAFRNCVFFVSLMEGQHQEEFLRWAEGELEGGKRPIQPESQHVLREALEGFKAAQRKAAGNGDEGADVQRKRPSDGGEGQHKKVLGWVVGQKPWLLA